MFLLQSILLIIFVTSANASFTPALEDTSTDYSFQKITQNTHLDGILKNETAYRISTPDQFAKIKNLLYLRAQSEVSDQIKLTLRGRLYYDAVFDLTNNYTRTVERDQEIEFSLRDAFIDISQGIFDLRLGKQQIVWGEALGTFVTDVVNPKDLREFILPDFDDIRIPQWSAHAEVTIGDRHLEIVWTPRPKFNQVGVPGSEFEFSAFSLPAGYSSRASATIEPPFRWENGEAGIRYTEYVHGLNYSLFYFYSFDDFPTHFRDIDFSEKVITYRPEYERLNLFGLTFAREYTGVVLKGEFLYGHKKSFPVSDLDDTDGVVKKDFLDYMLGVDVTVFKKIDVKIQLLQRIIANYDSRMLEDDISSTGAIWLGTAFQTNKIEPEILFLSSLDKKGWMIRPKVKFNIGAAWQWIVGGDFFGGKNDGYFGQFHDRDRIYSEIKFVF